MKINLNIPIAIIGITSVMSLFSCGSSSTKKSMALKKLKVPEFLSPKDDSLAKAITSRITTSDTLVQPESHIRVINFYDKDHKVLAVKSEITILSDMRVKWGDVKYLDSSGNLLMIVECDGIGNSLGAKRFR